MKSGNKWVKCEVLPELFLDSGKKITGYYRWPFQTEHENFAHIFFCDLCDETELRKIWRHMVELIAVYAQSETEHLLERSNFYVWFFVRGAVTKSLQKRIEDDTYSSKKYIVSYEEEMPEEEKLALAEKKLFTFTFPPRVVSGRMIQKIELRNFRCYRGTKTFDLGWGDKPARMVVLFAPNGMGKTSFFDGVEWAFTGEVDRFHEMGNQEFDGAVFRNREAGIREEALVKIELENKDWICRKIIKSEKYRDTGRGRASCKKGGRLGKLKDEKGIWKNLILQHHKIDGFIAAADPGELYREWGGLWDPSGEKRAVFEKSHAAWTAVRKEYEETSSQAEQLLKDYEKLNENRIFVERLKEDVSQFCAVSGEKQFAAPDFQKISASEYVEWCNQVDLFSDLYHKKREQNEKQKNYMENGFSNDCEKYCVAEKHLGDILKEAEEVRQKIAACRRKTELETTQAELKRQKDGNEKTLESFRFLYEKGEPWYDRAKQYFEAVTKAGKLQIEADNAKQSLNSLEQQRDALLVEKAGKEQELSEDVIYRRLCAHLEKMTERKERKGKLEEELLECRELADKLSKRVSDAERRRREQQEKYLHSFEEALDRYHTGELQKEETDEELEELRRLLTETLSAFVRQEGEMKRTAQEILTEEHVDKELHQILDESRKFISKQQLCECPVCHAPYDNMEMLIQKTYRTTSQKGEQLKEVQRVQEQDKKKLTRKAGQYLDAYHLRLTALLTEYDEKERKLKKRLEAAARKIEERSLSIAENEAEMVKLRQEDEKEGIFVVYSKEGIQSFHETWRSGREAESKLLDRRLAEIKSRIDSQKELLGQLAGLAEEEQKKILEVESGPGEIRMEIAREENNIRRYKFTEIGELYFQSEEQRDGLLHKIAECSGELETFLETETALLPYWSKRKKELYGEKERAEKEMEAVVKGIEALTPEALELLQCGNSDPNAAGDEAARLLEKLLQEQKRINECIEVLNRLKYNHEVENYFIRWKKAQKEVRDAKCSEAEQRKKEENARVEYQNEKKKIERDMQKFLVEFQVSDIYEKLEPHEEFKKLLCNFEFDEKEKPRLTFQVAGNDKKAYPPEWYFSTAQLNVVAFSVFLGRALQEKETPVKSIFIDDPVGHFDEMNVVGFADLLRNILENTDRQLIISTHEERVFGLLRRKIPSEEYPVKYIDFREES